MKRKNKANFQYTRADKVLLAADTLLLTVVFVVILYPLLFVVVASFSGRVSTLTTLSLWPSNPTLEGYRAVFEYKKVWIGYANSILYTIVGTAVNLLVTVCAAFPLSRSKLAGKNFIMLLFVVTMYISGGMIPGYLLVRDLKLLDTIWALVLPSAMSVYNMIVMRTFFTTNIPEELSDAAEVDGCGNIRFLVQIVLPLSGAVLAVIGLMYGVGHWNAYFNAMIYLRSENKYPLQIILRDLLIVNQMKDFSDYDPREVVVLQQRADLMRYSLIVIASLPVMCVYPFVQRFFVKGVMIGAIKG